MPKKAKLWLTLFICCISSQSFADAGWTEAGKILSLHTTSFSNFIVTAEFPDNVSGCRDDKRFFMGFGRPGSRFAQDLLIAAFTSGKRISLRVTGQCELKGMSEFSEVTVLAD